MFLFFLKERNITNYYLHSKCSNSLPLTHDLKTVHYYYNYYSISLNVIVVRFVDKCLKGLRIYYNTQSLAIIYFIYILNKKITDPQG